MGEQTRHWRNYNRDTNRNKTDTRLYEYKVPALILLASFDFHRRVENAFSSQISMKQIVV